MGVHRIFFIEPNSIYSVNPKGLKLLVPLLAKYHGVTSPHVHNSISDCAADTTMTRSFFERTAHQHPESSGAWNDHQIVTHCNASSLLAFYIAHMLADLFKNWYIAFKDVSSTPEGFLDKLSRKIWSWEWILWCSAYSRPPRSFLDLKTIDVKS